MLWLIFEPFPSQVVNKLDVTVGACLACPSSVYSIVNVVVDLRLSTLVVYCV